MINRLDWISERIEMTDCTRFEACIAWKQHVGLEADKKADAEYFAAKLNRSDILIPTAHTTIWAVRKSSVKTLYFVTEDAAMHEIRFGGSATRRNVIVGSAMERRAREGDTRFVRDHR